jgi:hypothetical protein
MSSLPGRRFAQRGKTPSTGGQQVNCLQVITKPPDGRKTPDYLPQKTILGPPKLLIYHDLWLSGMNFLPMPQPMLKRSLTTSKTGFLVALMLLNHIVSFITEVLAVQRLSGLPDAYCVNVI